jgi:subtilase family serine protease
MFGWQPRRDAPKAKNSHRGRLRICAVERLESRDLLSVAALADIIASPAVKLDTVKPGTGKPAAGSVAQGFITPAQLRQAYGFDQLANFSGNLPADGRGQTIAIVDAAGDPNIASDLKVFDAGYGLPNPNFQVVDLSNGTATPDPDWAIETALDVEWAHAVAPGANILLVQTQSDDVPDLLAGVQYAESSPVFRWFP